MKKTLQFDRLGIMLDCSRNAVANVESLKTWIDRMAQMGYTSLMLYTEDTYEVDDNPYFGYMRGRYTKQELRQIDAYAASKNIELIPCIQVLGHLYTIKRWPEYWPHFDTDDILLANDERVYALIESMFSTLSQCFTSKLVHIGMDEAHMLGRGRYLDQNGFRDGSQVLLEHLKRVVQIGEKYGFSFLMWSDMFFKLASGGSYEPDAPISDAVRAQIPQNVTLVYWDYYSTQKEHYDEMLRAHQALKPGSWFAGGIWSWAGFAPHNGYSIRVARAALQSCRENQTRNVFFTMWGDDGGECSRFSLLPALFYASCLAHGIEDEAEIKRSFERKYHMPFDEFAALDLPGTPNAADTHVCNAEKYLLYSDCFMGMMDCNVTPGTGAAYGSCAELLRQGMKSRTWGYLFATQKALCEVWEYKAELGVRTHEVYRSKDRQALLELIEDYRLVEKRIRRFYAAFRKQWMLENKPHGFDVQDIRIGGLLQRVESCRMRLKELYDGTIERIEELEEQQLDFFGEPGKRRAPEDCVNGWNLNVTANVISGGMAI